MAQVIQVWKYRGWCAICIYCKRSVVIDAGSQQNALAAGLIHLRHGHPSTVLAPEWLDGRFRRAP